ncbi:MAG: hypothetical protein RL510_458 [Actinomycetota bacterium]|jgi:hypothetical protein
MQRAKVGAFATGVLTLVYLVVLGQFGLKMIESATPVGVVMGSLVLIFPLFGLWFMVQEFRFGIRVEKLASRLNEEGAWPQFDLEVRPSGRVIRASADRVFQEQKAKTEQNPDDWREWFALSLAYDAAGDRSRARKAMREALLKASE